MKGKCKLCLEEKDLCKQSHIIPNFMYKGLFDDKNRIHGIRTEQGTLKHRGVVQTGEFDKNILCLSCENETLGNLDRYASLILYDGYPKILENQRSPDGLKCTYCAGIDYTQFKLFLLSVLWRSSITRRPLFNEVQLGPHDDRIRKMLLNEDPGPQLKYPCLIMTYLHLKDYPVDVVAQPSVSKVRGRYIYKFLIGGLIYVFFISKPAIPQGLNDIVINPCGEIRILHMSRDQTLKTLGSLIGMDLS